MSLSAAQCPAGSETMTTAVLPRTAFFVFQLVLFWLVLAAEERERTLPSFIASATVQLFKPASVYVLMEDKTASLAYHVTSDLYAANVSVRSININSRRAAMGFLQSVIQGLPVNTKVHVICLLNRRTYKRSFYEPMKSTWTHLVHSRWVILDVTRQLRKFLLTRTPCTFYAVTKTAQGYELLGPKSVTRRKCNGHMTLAKWPPSNNTTSVVVRSPAMEQRSSMLSLSCSAININGTTAYNCMRPSEAVGLLLICRYLNISRVKLVPAPLTFTPSKEFPEPGTYTGLLLHGIADVNFKHTVIDEPRAFAADFLLPIRYEKFAYMFPSPRVIVSTFAVLRVYSVQLWVLLGVSFLIFMALLHAMTRIYGWNIQPSFVTAALFLEQDTEPFLTCQRKASVRLFLGTLHFLCFMMSYSFTSGYISYLNLRVHETGPDTTERLFEMLRARRIEPCLAKNTYINVSLANPFSTTIKQLHDSVPDWKPFLAGSLKECVQRTVRRQAVMFSSLQNLERYAYSHRGYVQISREYIHDFTPMGYVLPKVSPYKEVLQSVVMRMFEAGLFDQFERFERYQHLPGPKNYPESSHEQVLRLRKNLLPFCCLGAGLSCALLSFSCEMLIVKFSRRKRARYFARDRDVPTQSIPVGGGVVVRRHV